MNPLIRQKDFPNKTQDAGHSTRWISSVLLALPIASILITSSNAETEEEKRCVMFERAEHVNLAEKEIPEFHKRNEITDTQKRTIKGEWVSIDRKNKTVKFRRADGKAFELAMANLATHDRRYAELESGYLWQIDPMPTPVDIIKEDILAFVSMDDTYIHLRCVHPNDPSRPYVPKLEINLLTDRDRARIKAATGRDIIVLPRPEPDGSSRAWKYPRPLFGHRVPEFKASYYKAILQLMMKTYSPEDVVDALRTRTLNSAFIHEFNRDQFEEAEPEKKTGTKSLAEILKIIGEVPSPATEEKSIRQDIAKFKLALYEEKTPRDPAEPKRFIRGERSILAQPGVPIDGQLQAIHYICQYMRLASNQPRIPLATLLENTTQKFSGVDHRVGELEVTYPVEQRRKFYDSQDILAGIEKTFGFKSWTIFIPEKHRNNYKYHNHTKPHEALQGLHDQLTFELIRQHIRDGKPVYAHKNAVKGEHRSHGTQLVITGFKAEAGKPLVFEAIALKGSISGHDPETGEYQIAETSVPQSEVNTMTAIFIEIP